MQRTGLLSILLLFSVLARTQTIIDTVALKDNFRLQELVIFVDSSEEELVKLSAGFLQTDIEKVTGSKPDILHALPSRGSTVILIGTAEKISLIKSLNSTQKTAVNNLTGKWEAYSIQSAKKVVKGFEQSIIISGSDRRGVAYGVFELSKQLGISPWYWWADVPVLTRKSIYVKTNTQIIDQPKVKYRGIFINDEAPALSGWTKEKFGGFNAKFYEKVFELILRLKGNYLWPAMWGNAFYDDDTLSIHKADQYGIVIGTSHHEPLMRAHDEWRRYGSGPWNYETNKEKLQNFWKEGMQRAWNEKIVSVGMRGDGDEPMSRETATLLLENIVDDQRKIISTVTGKPAERTPQLWALYKEVQNYYDQGMRVPDDVTLLLCDDNWGNIRRLPSLNEKPRKGGYGIYYHFDYVGGPRNYKWLNTNPLPRIWEQMHLAWQYNARQIWIVNVGDIKPMEFPISFFLDYAWDPEKIDADDIDDYTRQWAIQQFDPQHADQIAHLLSSYAKYNSRRKPELLDANTYSFNFNEWPRVVDEYKMLLQQAEQINAELSVDYKDAFYQLVLHPIKAMSNLYELYYNVALNHRAYKNRYDEANEFAEKAKEHYIKDSLITIEYHKLNNGKWNHLMSQTHIGYTYWQQPPFQVMPAVYYVSADSSIARPQEFLTDIARADIPDQLTGNVFYEEEESGVSVNADHFSRAIHSDKIKWKLLPDHGRTGSAMTSFPVTESQTITDKDAANLQYDFYSFSSGEVLVNGYFSPTLNFQNFEEGLLFAFSIDDGEPQIISLNKEDKTSDRGIWNKWAAENIIIKSAKLKIAQPGKHTLKYWMISPGVVLQKIVLDFGNVEPAYLGPPETIHRKNSGK